MAHFSNKMLNTLRKVFWLALLLLSSNVQSQEKVKSEVYDFIELLTRMKEPSLAEYSKFTGECGGNSELKFVFEECKKRNWDIFSKLCVDYSRQHCQSPDKKKSLKIHWLRERFSTTGKSYWLVRVEQRSEGFQHNLVEVKIGNNTFLLFNNAAPNIPTGLLVGVYKVNGKVISDYKSPVLSRKPKGADSEESP